MRTRCLNLVFNETRVGNVCFADRRKSDIYVPTIAKYLANFVLSANAFLV